MPRASNWLSPCTVCLTLILIAFATPVSANNTSQPGKALLEELLYVPPDALSVVILRPAAILQLPEIQEIPGASIAGPIPFKQSELESVTLVVSASRRELLDFGVILRFNRDIDSKRLGNWLVPGAEEERNPEFTFFFPRDARETSMQLLVLNSRTAIAAPVNSSPFDFLSAGEAKMQESTTDTSSQGILAQFANLPDSVHIAAAWDYDRFAHLMDSYSLFEQTEYNRTDERLSISNFGHKFQSLLVTADLSRKDGLTAIFNQPTLGLKEQLKKPGQYVRSFTSPLIRAFKGQVPKALQPRIDRLENSVMEFVDNARYAANGEDAGLKTQSLPAPAKIMKMISEVINLNLASSMHRQQLLKTRNSLMQIGLGMHNYHSAYGKFPTDIRAEDGTPLLSWRVAVLPFIEGRNLYQQFHLDEPWDSKHNRPLASKMPAIFKSRDSGFWSSKTHFQKPTGPGTPASEDLVKLGEFKDDSGGVLAVVEMPDSVNWAQPTDFESAKWSSNTPPRFALMYDGHTELLPDQLSLDQFKTLARDGTGNELAVSLFGGKEPRFKKFFAPLPAEQIEALIQSFPGWEPEKQSLEAAWKIVRAGRSYPQKQAEAVIAKMKSGLSHQDPIVRYVALQAIYSWSRGARIPALELVPLTADRYERNRWLAILLVLQSDDGDAIQRTFIQPEALKDCADLLQNENEQIRRALPKLADNLAKNLHNENFFVRLLNSSAIGELGLDRHRQLLVELKERTTELASQKHLEFLLNVMKPELGPLEVELNSNGQNLIAACETVLEAAQPSGGPLRYLKIDEHNGYNDKYQGHLSQRELEKIFSLDSLEYLDIGEARITDEILEIISKLPSLKHLDLGHCYHISPQGFAALKNCTQLEELRLSYTNINDIGAAAIAELSSLKELDLGHTDVGNEGLKVIAKLPNLETLYVGDTLVTDEGVAALRDHPTLNEFYAMGAGITDASIDTLNSIKDLSGTNLSSTGISELGMQRFNNSR